MRKLSLAPIALAVLAAAGCGKSDLASTTSPSSPAVSVAKAPTTAPARYAVATSPICSALNCSTGLSCRAPAIEPANVTSSPSRIQVMPSATTMRV